MTKLVERETRAALTLGALGVVYGDIGTSPLYTVKEVFNPELGVPLDAFHLIGAISVIFWGLMLVVSLKYVILILRADNRGEGGIMALPALWGGALCWGDSGLPPALSVLRAVAGLEVATPAFKPFVLPISIGIIIG